MAHANISVLCRNLFKEYFQKSSIGKLWNLHVVSYSENFLALKTKKIEKNMFKNLNENIDVR